LAKAIDKPVANVYKALYSLEQKGGILVEEGETRVCVAVPPKELLSRLDREFKERKAQAVEALSMARPVKEDDNVYRIASGPQVIERAHAMIQRAKDILLVDAFPALLEQLRDPIERAAARGVSVLVEAYEPVKLKKCRVVLHPSRDEILPNWPGDMLLMSRDGLESLQALLDPDGEAAIRATGTSNVFLSCHAYLAGVNNFALSQLMNQVAEGTSVEQMKRTLKQLEPMRLRNARGFDVLRRTQASLTD